MFLFRVISALLVIFSFSFASFVSAAEVTKPDAAKEQIIAAKKVNEAKSVNINTADLETLQTLKGIGPKKAQEIIDYRDKNGEFKKIDDLKSIKGFTDKFITKLQKDNPGLEVKSAN